MVALKLKMQKLRFTFHFGIKLEAFSVCEVFIGSLKIPREIELIVKEFLRMLNFVRLPQWLNMKTPNCTLG